MTKKQTSCRVESVGAMCEQMLRDNPREKWFAVTRTELIAVAEYCKSQVKTKKQTSDRVSRVAARVLRRLEGFHESLPACVLSGATVKDLRALAASCLSQDETKGKRTRRPAKRRAAK